jgi:monoamine oxidase
LLSGPENDTVTMKTSSDDHHDAIVVGGGLAGVSAARDLGDQGLSVLLLEAHDHLGGRSYYRRFADTDEMIEMGGGWVVHDKYLDAEIERYDVPLEAGVEAKTTFSVLNGVHRPGLLPPAEQWPDLERALFHHLQANARIVRGVPYDLQPVADIDVAWSEFVAPLELPLETYEFLTNYPGHMVGRYPDEASTLGLLSYVKAYGSLWALHSTYGSKFKGGTKRLIDALASDSGAEIRLEAPVKRVEQDAQGVSVTTAGGDRFTARAVVIATPMNLWKDIEFAPELGEHKREASRERHGSPRLRKFWAQVRNAPPDPYVMTPPESSGGALYLSADRRIGDDLLCYGHVMGPDTDVSTREGMERALAIFLPGAELVKFDCEDFPRDPYTDGSFCGYKPGRLSKSHSHLAAPEARLSFATADISFSSLVFFDGAIEMGRRAAAQAAAVVVHDRLAVA